MKTLPLAALVVVAGLGAGASAGFATSLLVAKSEASAAVAEAETPNFVPTGKILAPLVFADGRLAGYVSFKAELLVSEDRVEFVTARLPLLLHALNMRSYRTPMASGPDGMLPDLAVFRRLLMTASDEAFGKGLVKRAAITEAAPA